MTKVKLRLFDVVNGASLPGISVDQVPHEGDPIEVNGEMYYVCEKGSTEQDNTREIGVIPLVVRNPATIPNISTYIKCLTTAQRRIKFRKENNICDLEDCDEMVIS